MEKITKNNYEAFYLDYLEGNLSDAETSLLFSFFEANPDCKADIEDEGDILDFKIQPEAEHIEDKEELKYFDCKASEICLSNYNDWLVAKQEGDLSAEDVQKVDQFIAENNLEYQEKVMVHAVLEPNSNDGFGDISRLKKGAATGLTLQAISLDNYNDWLVAKVEGVLSAKEIKMVDFFISKHQLEFEQKAMNSTVLKPNLAEKFGSTSALRKKETKVISLLIRVTSIAAAIAILFVVFNWNSTETVNYISRDSNTIFITPEDLGNEEFIIELQEEKPNIEEPRQNQIKKEKVEEEVVPQEMFMANDNTVTPISPVDTASVKSKKTDQNSQKPLNIIKKVEPVLPDNNDLALATNDEIKPKQKKSPVRLKDRYKPITNTINNHTNLDVTYKQTDQSSDVAVTRIEVGRFSFERKRRR